MNETLFPLPERKELPPHERLRKEAEFLVQEMNDLGPMIPQQKAAELLGVSFQAIQNRVRRGTLTSRHLFGHVWIPIDELEEALQTPRKPGRPKKLAA